MNIEDKDVGDFVYTKLYKQMYAKYAHVVTIATPMSGQQVELHLYIGTTQYILYETNHYLTEQMNKLLSLDKNFVHTNILSKIVNANVVECCTGCLIAEQAKS